MDSATGIKTTYYYDFADRMMKYVESGTNYSHSVGYAYDEINNLTSLVETINGVKHTTAYTYDNDNRVTTVTNGNTSATYTYDGYSRVRKKVTKNGTATVLTDAFTYRTPTTGTTSGQVSEQELVAQGYIVIYTYTYDKNGNILSVSDGTNITDYAYDSAGQLLREDNQAAGKTWVWTYDNAGNISSRTEYAYTIGELGNAVETVTYTYGNSNWRDLLMSYDGQTITYDNIGNPLDDGTWEYTWEHGRQLASMTDGSTTWTYTYNADGLRTKRTNGTTTYSYVYNGSNLTQMTVGSDTLYFAYDGSSPMSVTYNGTNYYYATNLQGDVIAILNSSGTAVVQYTYDAWGNILTTTGSMASTLGAVNPLTYRGYVFDRETGLYFVSSRYYDSEIGRFINADSLVSTGQGILGNNMFAYCLNNPVNYIDRDGTNAEALQWWTTGMGWLPFADTALPIGDIIYVGGILLLGAIALASDQDYVPEISYDEADVAYGPPSPNNDDDDDDYDDYYDDESNFGGRQKVGKNKGSAPGNNQAQNKQFRDATKGLTPNQQRIVHDKITGKGLGYHEIKSVIKDLFVLGIGLVAFEE